MSGTSKTVNAMHMYKASSATSWSFIGIFIPVVGIIIAVNAVLHLRHFIPTDESEEQEKKRIDRRASWGLVASIVSLFVGVLFIVVVVRAIQALPSELEKGVQQQDSISSSSSSVQVSKPVQNVTAKVGDTVNVGGDQGLAVKLVQVIDPATGKDEFNAAEAGKHLVGVKLLITNKGESVVKGNANNNVKLIGSDNQSYSDTYDDIVGCTNFDMGDYTLASGASVTGCVNFEVPSGVGVAKVQFTPSSVFSGDIGEWLLK